MRLIEVSTGGMTVYLNPLHIVSVTHNMGTRGEPDTATIRMTEGPNYLVDHRAADIADMVSRAHVRD